MPSPGVESDATKKTWLFVVPWSLEAIGGVSEVVRNLMRQVERDTQFDARLLVPSWHGAGAVTGRADEHQPLSLREPGSRWVDVYHHTVFLLFLLPTVWRVHRYLRRHRVAVVNLHYPGVSAFYFAVVRLLRGIDRLVLSFHGADVTAAAAATGLRASLFRWTCRRADAVVGCSQAFATRIAATLELDIDDVAVIRNGIDLDACRAELDRAVATSSTDTDILCVASLEHKKGIDVLIRAFAGIAASHPSSGLVVVGRHTDYVVELEAQVAALTAVSPDIGRRIALVPGESHDRILHRMQRARLFVLPSRDEPFGIVLLEAGFVQAPVVATHVGGIPEIVEDGVSGLLVPSEDPDALAAAMDRLLNDDALSARLASALQRRVIERFTWAAAWKRYRDLGTVTNSVDRS